MTKNLKNLICVGIAISGLAIMSGCGDGSGGSSGSSDPHNCGSEMSWDAYSSMCKPITYTAAPTVDNQPSGVDKVKQLAHNTKCVVYDNEFGGCIK